MSGVQDKVSEKNRCTPAHFSDTAAESWVLGYMESMWVGEKVEAANLLGILHRRWPRHSEHDLAAELLKAINATKGQGYFNVLGSCTQVSQAALEKTA
jgi:hypothetical protein